LTFDATNAENFCTIIAIAPSPAQQGVIWVGTDDGNLQLTRDGGKTWSNLSERLPDCPKNAWIPQIEVSATNPGEAFVVVNNYRQNDWEPYLYHTTDFGRKWKRLADAKNVGSFCLSVVQDPVAPNLLFLGTDQGLYFSIDYGDSWTHWPAVKAGEPGGFPCVPVQDMKIHPRDGDLVIGTFGRAIWIMDNIAPLRELAKNPALFDQPFKLFNPQAAVLASWRSFDGARFPADASFTGANKDAAARVPVWIKPGAAPKAEKKEGGDKTEEPAVRRGRFGRGGPGGGRRNEKVDVLVLSAAGDTVRRFKAELDTCLGTIYWGLDTRGVQFPSNREADREQDEPGGGPRVLPGTYWLKAVYGKFRDSVSIQVQDDPRLGLFYDFYLSLYCAFDCKPLALHTRNPCEGCEKNDHQQHALTFSHRSSSAFGKNVDTAN
ncbi:hypothetical protein HUU05_04460, partial [candidate division KSB1 bacterium]|nr:hypothetical protein [candidate division KSB1 bacterium]